MWLLHKKFRVVESTLPTIPSTLLATHKSVTGQPWVDCADILPCFTHSCWGGGRAVITWWSVCYFPQYECGTAQLGCDMILGS